MKVEKTAIDGLVILEPQVFGDERGYFFESYNKKRLEEALGYAVNFVQDNESKSSRGVFRGFAYQAPPFTQAKLVRVTQGKVLDIALDIRKDSPTFGKHVATELTDENKKQLFIPRGMAHAFLVLSEEATFQYKVDNYFTPEVERGVIFNDASLGLNLPMDVNEIKVSEKDLSRPLLKEAEVFTAQVFKTGEYNK